MVPSTSRRMAVFSKSAGSEGAEKVMTMIRQTSFCVL
jgi:hypothetical protein